MRNLKKVFAVITVIAMIATMMVVPALAEGLKYENEAKVLNDLGLMQGYGLEDKVNRTQGLIFAIKAAGKAAEVEAMTDEEAAAILAEKVVDADQVPTWAVKWVAYAVDKGYTSGVDASVAPKVKFAPLQEVSGTSFLVWLMKIGMGYEVGTDTAVSEAVNAGVITLNQAMELGTKAELIRDDAAGILYGACKNGVNADGTRFIEALINAGFISKEAAIAAGLVEAVPEKFEVVGAIALNLVQVEVEFNQPVDEDSAKDKDHYKIDKVVIKNVDLLDDGKTVVLTFDADDARKQQDKVDLTIEGVKSANGKTLAKTTIKGIEFIDTEIPTVVDGSVIGSDTIKIVFSEPMDPKTVTKSNFSINSGKLYIKEVKLQNNYTEALVVLYSNLKEGEVTVQVKSGNEDFAGFGVVGKLLTLTVVEDNDAPVVVGYEKASKGGITLIWSEDIKANIADSKIGEYYYHTNSKNPAKKVEIDGNKTKIEFDTKENPMPEVAYVYVMKEAVKDYWNNKNTQQMIKIEYEADEEPPVVEEIEVKSQSQIVIKFNEDLDEESAEDRDNYTLLDKDGKEIKSIIRRPINYSDKKVTIDFKQDLNGDYSIVIEGVKDTSDNEIEKVTISFTVDDKVRPNPDDFKAKVYKSKQPDQMLKISFGEAMATDGKYSVTDLEKYSIIKKGTNKVYYLADIDDVEIVVVDDGKAVEIKIPSEEDLVEDGVKLADRKLGENFIPVEAGDKVKITRVADAAGNYMLAAEKELTIEASGYIGIDKVEATARDKVVVTLKDRLDDFDIDDLWIVKDTTDIDFDDDGEIDNNVTKLEYAGVNTSINDDGNTVITIELADTDTDKLAYDTNNEAYLFVVGTESENVYGETLQKNLKKGIAVKDKIAPELYDDGNDEKDKAKVKDYLNWNADSTFEIIFSESMQLTNTARAGSDFVITANGDVLVNGVDYEVIRLEKTYKDNDTVRFALIGDYVGFDGDLEIEKAEKTYYVKDANGNDVGDFEIESFEVKNYAQVKEVSVTTDDTIAVVTVKMSEKLSGKVADKDAFKVHVNDSFEGITVEGVTVDGKEIKITITISGVTLNKGDKVLVLYGPTGRDDLKDQEGVEVPSIEEEITL